MGPRAGDEARTPNRRACWQLEIPAMVRLDVVSAYRMIGSATIVVSSKYNTTTTAIIINEVMK